MNVQTDPKALTTVKDIMFKNSDYLRKLIPSAMNHDRFIVASLSVLRQQPTLMTCSPSSFFGALVQCAQLGLVPGVLGLAYFVPFWNNEAKTREVQLIPGYKGLMSLAYRSERIHMIDSHTRRVKDNFYVQYGSDPKVEHVPADGERGEMMGFYCIIGLSSGRPLIQYMSLEEVEAHRMRYSKAAKKGPWVTDYEPMCLKTVIRKCVKFAPMSTELARGVFLDESAEGQFNQGLDEQVFDWQGLEQLEDWQEKAHDQTAEDRAEIQENVFAMTAPPFGVGAGKPLGLVPSKILSRYRAIAVKTVEDPTKAKFHKENQARIDAIDKVMAARTEVESLLASQHVTIKPEELLGDADHLEELKTKYAKPEPEAHGADDQAAVQEVPSSVDPTTGQTA